MKNESTLCVLVSTKEAQLRLIQTLQGDVKHKIKLYLNRWFKIGEQLNNELRKAATMEFKEAEEQMDTQADYIYEILAEMSQMKDYQSYKELAQFAKRTRLNEKNKLVLSN